MAFLRQCLMQVRNRGIDRLREERDLPAVQAGKAKPVEKVCFTPSLFGPSRNSGPIAARTVAAPTPLPGAARAKAA